MGEALQSTPLVGVLGGREPLGEINLTIRDLVGIQREALAVVGVGKVVKGVMAMVVMGAIDKVIRGETEVMAEVVRAMTMVRAVEVMGASDVAVTITQGLPQGIITVAGRRTAVRSHGVGDTGMGGEDKKMNQRQSDLFSAF